MLKERLSPPVGKTPLVRITRLTRDAKVIVLAKLESANPTHSIKDRVARQMIADAERRGQVKAGTAIIEPTSGNLAISLASLCARQGLRLVLVMPESVTTERVKLLKAMGAEVVLTPKREGMIGAARQATEIAGRDPAKYFMPQQFKNPAGPAAHERTTARELWKDTQGTIDILVSAVGTGGTITGCARFLKKKKPGIRIVAVEPASSAVLSGGKPGPHAIVGIGAGFVPSLLARELIDEVVAVTDQAALETTRLLAREEGILAGPSSGAAAWAAIELARRGGFDGKTIVFICPDSGERYVNAPGLFDA